MPEKITISITARGYELDSYNHVNNAVYLNYFEHARWEFFRQLNLSDFLTTQGNLPVVTDLHVRYQREIRLFDELSIESTCTHEKPYLVFRQRILNKTTGLTAARATTKLIFIGHDRIVGDVPSEVLSVLSANHHE
jgi:YbgC/YbaW family acyl-CoA thioester hydrolase